MICIDCGNPFTPRSLIQMDMELCDGCFLPDADLDDIYPEDHEDDYLRAYGQWIQSGQVGPCPT